MQENPKSPEDQVLSSAVAMPAKNGNDSASAHLSRARMFLLFSLLSGVLYVQTLGCPFLWDEYRLILGNAQADAFDWNRLPDLFSQHYFYTPGSFQNDLPFHHVYYRPVTVLFHGLSYKAFGTFFPAYHLESLFLHVGNALLLFSLLSTLFREPRASPLWQAVALAAAVLFLIHPRNVETVSIISNQTGLLCTFFCLISLLLWARVLRGANHPRLRYGLSLLALLLAMLSKETAYGAPLMHGLLLVLVGPRDKNTLLLLSGYFLVPMIPLVIRQTCLGGPSITEALAEQWTQPGSQGTHFVSVLCLLLHQLYVWLLPVDIQLFQYPLSTGELSPQQILIPMTVLILTGWRLRRQKSILALGLGWFLVFYLPSSNVISFGTIPGNSLKTGAHHLYPAHAGLCLLLAAAILLPWNPKAEQPRSRRIGWLRWPALALLVLFLGSQTFLFTGYFRGADAFYKARLERYPVDAGAWTNYGWHKLYIDRDPLHSEWILLGGLQAVEENQIDLLSNPIMNNLIMNNLIVLNLKNGRRIEAETTLQCIMDSWVVHPIKNLYFWQLVELRDDIVTSPREKGAGIPK